MIFLKLLENSPYSLSHLIFVPAPVFFPKSKIPKVFGHLIKVEQIWRFVLPHGWKRSEDKDHGIMRWCHVSLVEKGELVV